QVGALIVAERPEEADGAPDLVDARRLPLLQLDLHPLQRPALPVGVHLHRDRRARAQRREEKVVRRRPRVIAADVGGLVAGQGVGAQLDVLLVLLADAGRDPAGAHYSSTPGAPSMSGAAVRSSGAATSSLSMPSAGSAARTGAPGGVATPSER